MELHVKKTMADGRNPTFWPIVPRLDWVQIFPIRSNSGVSAHQGQGMYPITLFILLLSRSDPFCPGLAKDTRSWSSMTSLLTVIRRG